MGLLPVALEDVFLVAPKREVSAERLDNLVDAAIRLVGIGEGWSGPLP